MAVAVRIWRYPDSYIMINGEKKAPDSYTVKRGDTITVMINAKNHGDTGAGWLGVMDRKILGTPTEQIAWWQSFGAWRSGEVKYYTRSITVDRDMELYLVGGKLTSEGRVIQDTYGVWSISVSEAAPPEEAPPAPPGEEKGIPVWVWVLLAVLVGLFIFKRRK